MMVSMLLPLVLNVLPVSPPNPVATRSNEPPVKVWLSSKGTFSYGEKAKAYVQSAEDGYVVVLQVEPRGHFRVLFPVDPKEDQFLKGGKKYEIKGRGDRAAFMAEDSGQGVVFAAFSKSRFAVEKFTQNGHWDYRALAGDSNDDDIEARVMDIVQEMQPTEHFVYDVANYVVGEGRYAHQGGYDRGGYGYVVGPRVGFGLMVGRPFFTRGFGYGAFGYDPFYSPFARYGPGPYQYRWGGIRSWGR